MTSVVIGAMHLLWQNLMHWGKGGKSEAAKTNVYNIHNDRSGGQEVARACFTAQRITAPYRASSPSMMAPVVVTVNPKCALTVVPFTSVRKSFPVSTRRGCEPRAANRP